MLFVLAAISGALTASPTADPATVAAITSLETRWGEAFVKRDFGFINSIIAPEYALSGTTPSGDIATVTALRVRQALRKRRAGPSEYQALLI